MSRAQRLRRLPPRRRLRAQLFARWPLHRVTKEAHHVLAVVLCACLERACCCSSFLQGTPARSLHAAPLRARHAALSRSPYYSVLVRTAKGRDRERSPTGADRSARSRVAAPTHRAQQDGAVSRKFTDRAVQVIQSGRPAGHPCARPLGGRPPPQPAPSPPPAPRCGDTHWRTATRTKGGGT